MPKAKELKWQVESVSEGFLEDLKVQSLYKDTYGNLITRLCVTELPATIKLKIKPQTIEAVSKARKNINQWFWRWFGAYYVETRGWVDDKGILYVVLYRGKSWYHPKMRGSKK